MPPNVVLACILKARRKKTSQNIKGCSLKFEYEKKQSCVSIQNQIINQTLSFTPKNCNIQLLALSGYHDEV
jgi:hypothetical protein